MSRLTGTGAGSLANAYASIYEGYGKKKEEKKGEDCTAASEKTTHNCAKKVCHEEFGEGTCVYGQHAVPDRHGFVSHYDVEFSHGIEKGVPVSEMKVLEEGSHSEEAHEGMYDGEQLAEAPQYSDDEKRTRAAVKQQNVEFKNRGGLLGQMNRAFTGTLDTLSGSGNRYAAADQASQNRVRQARSAATGNYYSSTTGKEYKDYATALKDPKVAAAAAATKNKPTKPVTPTPTKPVQPAKPQLSAQDQKTNTEYDRLRKTDPKAAVEYGKKMAQQKFGNQLKPKTRNPLLDDGKNGENSISSMIKRSQERQKLNQDVDLFDLVKGHLIDEGASEEEVMKIMVSMTQEEILAFAEGYDEPKMHAAVKRVMSTQPAAKGRAASGLHSKYSMRSKGNTAGETDGPGPNAPKRSGRKGRGAETDRGSGNKAKRRMDK